MSAEKAKVSTSAAILDEFLSAGGVARFGGSPVGAAIVLCIVESARSDPRRLCEAAAALEEPLRRDAGDDRV